MLVDAPQYIVARNRNRRAAVRRGKKRQPALRDTVARNVNRRTQYVMARNVNRRCATSWQEALTGAQDTVAKSVNRRAGNDTVR
jgi:hypothetical protein